MSNPTLEMPIEVTQAMLSLADLLGSNTGTGLMQTLAAFAIRELYKKSAAAKLASTAAAEYYVFLSLARVRRPVK